MTYSAAMFRIKYLLYFIGALLLTGDIYITSLELEEDWLYIIGLFDLYNENGGCDPPDEETIITMIAVKWYITQVFEKLKQPFNLGYSNYGACNVSNDKLDQFTDKVKTSENVIGFISSFRNRWTAQLASTFGMSDILRLAISSTAEEFADRANYPDFYRVIPGDSNQLKTMVHLIGKLGQRNIAIIHESSTYQQRNAFDLFHAVHGKSVAATIITTQFEDAERRWKVLYNIFRGFLSTKTKPEVVVFFGHQTVARNIFRVLDGAEFKNLYIKAFIFSATVGIDGEVFSQSTNSGRKRAIFLSPPYKEIKSFSNYWISLFTNMTLFKSEMESLPLIKHVFKHHSATSCDPETHQCPAFTLDYASDAFNFQPLSVQYGILASHIMIKLMMDISARICPINTMCTKINKNRHLMVQEMSHLTVDLAEDFNVPVLPLSSSGFWLTYNGLHEPSASSTDEVYQVYIFRNDANTRSRHPSRIQVGSLSYNDVLTLDISALKAHGFEIFSGNEDGKEDYSSNTGNGNDIKGSNDNKTTGNDSDDSPLFFIIGSIIGLLVLGLLCAVAVFVCKKRKKNVNDELYMYITPTTETPDGSVCSYDRISILPHRPRNLELYSFDHYDEIAENPDNEQNQTCDELGEQFNVPSGEQISQRSQQMKRYSEDADSPNVNVCTPRLHDSM